MSETLYDSTQAEQGEKTPSIVEYHYAIIEQSCLSATEQAAWDNSRFARMPLMTQSEFSHLRDEGPWLVALGEQTAPQLASLREDLGESAIQGWLSSYLVLAELAEHLSDALVVRGVSGRTVLLRSYAPHVLPVLHERSDCPWHAWLFGPVNTWSLTDKQGHRQTYSGGGLQTAPAYEPIELDEQLMTALVIDQQTLVLVGSLEAMAPEVFTSTCQGERFEKVQRALKAARETALTHADDHQLFAILYLLEGQPPSIAKTWPEVIRLVVEEGYDLGRALEIIQEDGRP